MNEFKVLTDGTNKDGLSWINIFGVEEIDD